MWRFDFAAAVWLPEIHGPIDLRALSTDIDIGFGDVLDFIGSGDFGAGMGRFEAERVDLGITLFVDSYGLVVSENDPHAEVDSYVGPYDTGNVDIDQSLAVVDFGIGYRLGTWTFPGSARGIRMDALAGGRYVHYSTDMRYNIGGLAYREDLIGNLWSPFLGGRWQLDVLDNVAVAFRGDIGGFTIGDQLSWGLEGMLRYRLPWTPCGTSFSAMAGYRLFALEWSHIDDPVSTGFPVPKHGSLNLQFRGPFLGVAAAF